jgi:hypothetical protein
MTNFKHHHPVRMTFDKDADDRPRHNPVVLLIIFEHDCVSVETAKQIVLAITDKVDTLWKGEQYVF